MSAPPWQQVPQEEEEVSIDYSQKSQEATQPVSDWHEVKTEDGRVYYYDSISRRSVWEKPEELMNEFERKLSKLAWKEYTTADGKQYWYNVNTRESVWEIPEEYRKAIAEETLPETKQAFPHLQQEQETRSEAFPESLTQQARPDREQTAPSKDAISRKRAPNFVPPKEKRHKRADHREEDFDTYEAAERAFFRFLDSFNVTPSWTWEQAVHELCTEKGYYVIKNPWERKCAFDAYIMNYLTEQSDREKNRILALRKDFFSLLKSRDDIHSYTLWRTAKTLLADEAAFLAAPTEFERQLLFFEHRQKLKEDEEKQEKNNRKNALDDFCVLLNKLELDPYTRWNTAQEKFENDPRYQKNPNMKHLSKLEALTVYESHIKHLEREYITEKQRQKKEKYRTERKNRDAFRTLLLDLRQEKKITLRTKWKEIYPLFKDDPRYLNMLGQPGSTPLDLFWDIIVEFENEFREKRNVVLDCLQILQLRVEENSDVQEFVQRVMQSLKENNRDDSVSEDIVSEVIIRTKEKIAQRKADEKKADERRIRRKIDNLRSAIKYIEPPIPLSATYEEMKPVLSKLPEFSALDSEEYRVAAFDKYIRRQREKAALEKQNRIRRGYYDEGGDSAYGGYTSGTRVYEMKPPLDYDEDLPMKSDRHVGPPGPAHPSNANDFNSLQSNAPPVSGMDGESSEEGEIH
ncbi:U1 snRNP-associated protein Usp104 [Schizosaccharomyces cryophilus OY26]|uniref:U1 snRNP-associated protein Usp104 n=1 Tax=Schizosaccharomyces cryophilus (strain OY26 / ATCC MYA-4695 / CBS 11777 / NBRC 106824 / NRRL Y48691) TaxID=653667 RepID=S9W5E8_SCHCR|nr:U1 snRNP-associated protein Usp104 [Schizosaccharomyces cryophilus OY26]EPY53160.1 U1 snRNP-associated protein Usp104 [Schizosaccharomyces cryophilus OY26]